MSELEQGQDSASCQTELLEKFWLGLDVGRCWWQKIQLWMVLLSSLGFAAKFKHKQSSGQWLGGEGASVLPAPHFGTAGTLGTQHSVREPRFLNGLWSSAFLALKNSWHTESPSSAYLIKEWKRGCFSSFSTLVRNEWGNSWQGWALWWGSLASFPHWDEHSCSSQGMQACRGRASLPCSHFPKRQQEFSSCPSLLHTTGSCHFPDTPQHKWNIQGLREEKKNKSKPPQFWITQEKPHTSKFWNWRNGYIAQI